MQAAAGDTHWDKCFAFVKRMVEAVPEKERKVRPQQPAGKSAAADADAEKPAETSAEAPAEKATEAPAEKARLTQIS